MLCIAHKEKNREKVSAHLDIYSLSFFKLSLALGLDFEFQLVLTLGFELGLEVGLGQPSDFLEIVKLQAVCFFSEPL